MTMEEKIKQYRDSCKDNDIDYKKLREEIEFSSWTNEDEKKNNREFDEIQEMEKKGLFDVVCQGIIANKRKNRK